MRMDKWWTKFAASRKGSTTLTSYAASLASVSVESGCQHVSAWVDSACMSVHDSFVTQFGGVFRQLYADAWPDAWPRDHGWGHDVEIAGDEFLCWRVESKDEV